MAKSDMKEDTKMDKTQDKAMIKKAFAQHDAQEHKSGKGTKLALKKGGMAKKMAMGGPAMQLKTNMRDAGKKSNAIPYVNPTPNETGSIGAAINSAAKTASSVSGQPYTPVKTLLKKGGMAKKMAMGGPTKPITSYKLSNGTNVTAGSTDLNGRTFGQKGYVPTPVLKKGGMAKGCGYSKGGQLSKANGVAVRGKTKGRII